MGYCVIQCGLGFLVHVKMICLQKANKTCINFNYFENERDLSFTTLNGQLSCLLID